MGDRDDRHRDRDHPRLYCLEYIDQPNATEQLLERGHRTLMDMMRDRSELELHNEIQTKASQSKEMHNELAHGLLFSILTSPKLAVRHLEILSFIVRDSYKEVVDRLFDIALGIDFYRLEDTTKIQIVWLAGHMTELRVSRLEDLLPNLIRQIRSGDFSNLNLRFTEGLIDILIKNRVWVEQHSQLTSYVCYFFLRSLKEHVMNPELQEKEVRLCLSLLRNKFEYCVLSGRELVRALHDVARIPEFKELWKIILNDPRTLWPQFEGIVWLLKLQTQDWYFEYRHPLDITNKLFFLMSEVESGRHNFYLRLFRNYHLSAPGSHVMLPDLIRYICGTFHPSNTILASKVITRYEVIGHLLREISDPVIAADCKLSLFYDWLFFDKNRDNIMNIEPGVLLMVNSIDTHSYMSEIMIEFLAFASTEYFPPQSELIRRGIESSMELLLEKGVLRSLEPLYHSPNISMDCKGKLFNLFGRFLGGGLPLQIAPAFIHPKEVIKPPGTFPDSSQAPDYMEDEEPIVPNFSPPEVAEMAPIQAQPSDHPRYQPEKEDRSRSQYERNDSSRYQPERDDHPRYQPDRDGHSRYQPEMDEHSRYQSECNDHSHYQPERIDHPRYQLEKDDHARSRHERDERSRQERDVQSRALQEKDSASYVREERESPRFQREPEPQAHIQNEPLLHQAPVYHHEQAPQFLSAQGHPSPDDESLSMFGGLFNELNAAICDWSYENKSTLDTILDVFAQHSLPAEKLVARLERIFDQYDNYFLEISSMPQTFLNQLFPSTTYFKALSQATDDDMELYDSEHGLDFPAISIFERVWGTYFRDIKGSFLRLDHSPANDRELVRLLVMLAARIRPIGPYWLVYTLREFSTMYPDTACVAVDISCRYCDSPHPFQAYAQLVLLVSAETGVDPAARVTSDMSVLMEMEKTAFYSILPSLFRFLPSWCVNNPMLIQLAADGLDSIQFTYTISRIYRKTLNFMTHDGLKDLIAESFRWDPAVQVKFWVFVIAQFGGDQVAAETILRAYIRFSDCEGLEDNSDQGEVIVKLSDIIQRVPPTPGLLSAMFTGCHHSVCTKRLGVWFVIMFSQWAQLWSSLLHTNLCHFLAIINSNDKIALGWANLEPEDGDATYGKDVVQWLKLLHCWCDPSSFPGTPSEQQGLAILLSNPTTIELIKKLASDYRLDQSDVPLFFQPIEAHTGFGSYKLENGTMEPPYKRPRD